MRSISIRINGEPKPKGSVSAFPVVRKSGRWGAKVVHPKATMEWQRTIEEYLDVFPSMPDGPLRLVVKFWLTKLGTVKREIPYVKPDLDKLCRVIGDSLERTSIISNDSRIVELVASKHYATDDESPGVDIFLETVQ